MKLLTAEQVALVRSAITSWDGEGAPPAAIVDNLHELCATAAFVSVLAKALNGLFDQLDYTMPEWRQNTLGCAETGDSVNVAWDACAAALDRYREEMQA